MLLYSVCARFEEQVEIKANRKETINRLHQINSEFDRVSRSGELLLRAVDMRKNKLIIAALVRDVVSVDEEKVTYEIMKALTQCLGIKASEKLELKEITSAHFASLLKRYSVWQKQPDVVAIKMQESLPKDESIFQNDPIFWEEIIRPSSKSTCKKKIKKIYANEVLAEEMDRIYSKKHPKIFRGIPVHYNIVATSEENAKDILHVLIQGLYENKRILGKRVTHIKLKSAYQYTDRIVERILKASAGSCVVIDLFDYPELNNSELWQNESGEWEFSDDEGTLNDFGRDDEWWSPGTKEAAEYLAATAAKYSNETQIFFVENSKASADVKQLIKAVNKKINIIEIREGLNSFQAQHSYKDMIYKAGLGEYYDTQDIFEKDKYYSEEDVTNMFTAFYQTCMTDKIYVEYSNHNCENDKEDNAESSYSELHRLIGLSDVKQLINSVIAVYKANKMRNSYGEHDETASLAKHMLFTGNPGTAKTTVARLMAKAMKEEGILKTGVFIECSRADLVGQFVGWTAVKVKEMFKKAKGGVLFIDEAYSLVDDSNSFGDEAINTIVSEMENNREDVIVIFAGYPKKMKAFLDKNEGLKSRIPYHINFPDYTPEELLMILEKLACDRNFILSPDAKKKTLEIFMQVAKSPDFGNGRFARNILEKAIYRQAGRITSMPADIVDKESLFTLIGEDFTYSKSELTSKESNKIGFVLERG